MLAAERRAAVGRGLLIDELYGQPRPRVFRAAARVMRGDARVYVFGYARVESTVGATQDVDVPSIGTVLLAQRPRKYNNVSLYMRKRPNKITPNQANNDTAATALALPGASPSGATPAS